jgi:hypothetical protein
MNYLARARVLALTFGLCACASVPMAPSNWDATAKTFQAPPPDRAYVYVYRNQALPPQVRTKLFLDRQPAGTIVRYTFALLPVRPGHHTLVAEGESKDVVQPIDVRGGESVFVWLEIQGSGSGPAPVLHLVPQEEGREWVPGCNLIAFPPPPLPPAPATAPVPAETPAPLPAPVSGSPVPPAVQ